MNTSQASTSNDDGLKLYLNSVDISFLLRLTKKSEKVFPAGQEKLESIYLDIDYACKHNIGFDPVETSREIKRVEDVINEYKDIEEEVSEGIVLGYITKKDQPKAFEKLTKYRGFLGDIEKFKKILYTPD